MCPCLCTLQTNSAADWEPLKSSPIGAAVAVCTVVGSTIAYRRSPLSHSISHVASYTSPARTKLYAMVACRGRDRSQSVLSRMMNVVLPSTMWPGCVLWRVCPRPAGGLDGEDGGHPVRDGAEPQSSRHRGCSAGAFLRCPQQCTPCLLLHGLGTGQWDTTLDNAHKGQSVV